MANPPLRSGLLATELLRDMHGGESRAVSFALDLIRVVPLEVSEYSVMVVTAACPSAAELALLHRLLQNNCVHSITASISRRALRLLETLQPPVLLTVDDAIVAATALVRGLPLYTLAPARFAAVPGLTAIQPY